MLNIGRKRANSGSPAGGPTLINSRYGFTPRDNFVIRQGETAVGLGTTAQPRMSISEMRQASMEELSKLPNGRKIRMIAVYNYKGGVGKTTNLIQIAATLARSRTGIRTVMVDADPQCNLTSFFKPRLDVEDQFDEEITEDEETLESRLREDEAVTQQFEVALWGEGNNNVKIDCERLATNAEPHDELLLRNDDSEPSLFTALQPVFRGNIDRLEPPTLQPLPGDRFNQRLFLLAGSAKIVQYEQPLSMVDANDNTAVPLLGAFRRLVLMTAQLCGAEIVLVDFGPSSGILNQVFVMSCDYILPPCFADFYSICSADGFLNSLLPMWIRWHRRRLNNQREILREAPEQRLFEFKATPPRVLPFVITAYKMNYNGNCVAGPSSQWIKDLQSLAESEILKDEIKACLYPLDGLSVIPLLDHVGQLMQHSHESKRAIIELSEDILVNEVGLDKNAAKQLQRRVNNTRRRYTGLAKALAVLP